MCSLARRAGSSREREREMVRSSLDCRDDRGRCPLRPDQAPLTLRGAVLCVQGISPHAAEGTKRHGLCSLLLPALGPDRRPPALAPVTAPSQHHVPLPPNGIRARIWLADVPAAGTPITPPVSVSSPHCGRQVAGRFATEATHGSGSTDSRSTTPPGKVPGHYGRECQP